MASIYAHFQGIHEVGENTYRCILPPPLDYIISRNILYHNKLQRFYDVPNSLGPIFELIPIKNEKVQIPDLVFQLDEVFLS